MANRMTVAPTHMSTMTRTEGELSFSRPAGELVPVADDIISWLETIVVGPAVVGTDTKSKNTGKKKQTIFLKSTTSPAGFHKKKFT